MKDGGGIRSELVLASHSQTLERACGMWRYLEATWYDGAGQSLGAILGTVSRQGTGQASKFSSL